MVAGQEGLVALLGAREAGLDELHELAQVTGRLKHRVKLEVHAGTAEVPEDEDLLVLQRVDVHLGVLRGGLVVGEVLAVDARDDVVAVTEDALLERGCAMERLAVNLVVNGDVMPEEVALAVHDVRLAAMQNHDAVPLARPGLHVEEELEVPDVLVGVEHAREVVGGAQKLEVLVCRRADVLLDGRVRMARGQRVRVDVAADANHMGPASKARCLSGSL